MSLLADEKDRSNYKIVSEKGLDIRSEKYGNKPNYKFHAGKLHHEDCQCWLMILKLFQSQATPR